MTGQEGPTVIGIDLGTVQSSVSIRRGAGSLPVRIKEPTTGSFSIPSSVRWTGEQLVFGETAERGKRLRPASYRSGIKRDLAETFPVFLNDREYLPLDLVAAYLGHLRELTEAITGPTPDRVVVTVPASYDAHRRALMAEATARAGFVAESVLLAEEPTAAAVAALREHEPEPGQHFLVYDFGGGTFDATIVGVEQDGSIVARDDGVGLPDCGGWHIDQRIRQALDCDLDGGEGISAVDPEAVSDMRRALDLQAFARTAKHHLSMEQTFEDLTPDGGAVFRLTRAELAGLVDDLIDRTLVACDQLLEGVGLRWLDLTAVVTIGGTTRLPFVSDRLESHGQRPIISYHDPELAVADGAAWFGERLPLHTEGQTTDRPDERGRSDRVYPEWNPDRFPIR